MFQISKITISRIFNVTYATIIFLLSKVTASVKPQNQPITLTLEIASICNLKCPECPSGKGLVSRTEKFMSPNLAQSIIERHSKTTLVGILYFQGEPMLNPNWHKIAKFASQHKIYTLMSTNGTMLNKENCHKLIESKVDKLIVSVDGITQESNQKYRVGSNLESIILGIRQLAAMKKEKQTNHPKIVVQTLLTRETENQCKKIKQFARTWGANRVEFKTIQLYNHSWENIQKWLPTKPKFRRYNIKNNRIVLPNRNNKSCWRLLSNAVYTSDGNLVPCCYDKTGKHSFGEFDQNPWFSDSRKEFITNMNHRKYADICKNCTEI